jgi:ATP-dependent DNA helicase RecQ
MNVNIKTLIQDYESAVCKIILYCITELPFPLGIKKIISVLKGSKSIFIINYELHNLATYSIFSTFTAEYLRTIMEALVKAELLEVEFVSEYKNMPVLEITTKGREFIAGKYEVGVQFLEDFVDRSVPEFDDFEKELFDKLRKLRREIAQERDIPAFMICGDITLRELTKQKPSEAASLLSVRGIGEKFVQNYGDKFIETITRHINDKTKAEKG